ncbi:MAG: putative immunity protein [Anaerolineae bacterium]|jgi:hypothetical protein|nr:hypothetical protein [Chloroflexota bacterium]
MVRRYRRMWTDWQAPCLQSLVDLVQTQSKATLVEWCLGYAEQHLAPIYGQAFPGDERPLHALQGARAWLRGEVKLPAVKGIILQEAHAAAREAEGHPAAQGAARAIAQCASSIHAARHCLGLALYGALALAYQRLGPEAPWEELERAAAEECGRMEAALRAMAVADEPHPARIDWRC